MTTVALLVTGFLFFKASLANAAAEPPTSTHETAYPSDPGSAPRPTEWPTGIRPDPDDPMGVITDDSAVEWAGWEGCGDKCPPPPR